MVTFDAFDHVAMARALGLAERGLETTQPNPRVGCVIARDKEFVGEGWHVRAGGPHAEVFALREAGAFARGATAYVTLEPCGLHGRTPPCADALIEARVARVVIASEDVFQRDGGAMARLRAAGIVVDGGLMSDAARALNAGFFSRIERGRPWVRVKLAMSLDGRTALANGASQWITGAPARADVQRWRARSSAILTGIGTVLADDPALTVRRESSALSVSEGGTTAFTPLRVILDRDLRTPRRAKVLDANAPTLLLHGKTAEPDAAHFATTETAALESTANGLDLDAVLALLGRRGVNELQVEAGATLSGALFAAGLVDELLLYVAPVLLGDTARPLLALPRLDDMRQRWRLRIVDQVQVGDDIRLRLARA